MRVHSIAESTDPKKNRRFTGLPGKLPVSRHAFEMTDQITAITPSPQGWSVHGKTGSGFPQNADGSDDRAHGWGWFVGWASKRSISTIRIQLIPSIPIEETVGAMAELVSAVKDCTIGVLEASARLGSYRPSHGRS